MTKKQRKWAIFGIVACIIIGLVFILSSFGADQKELAKAAGVAFFAIAVFLYVILQRGKDKEK